MHDDSDDKIQQTLCKQTINMSPHQKSGICFGLKYKLNYSLSKISYSDPYPGESGCGQVPDP